MQKPIFIERNDKIIFIYDKKLLVTVLIFDKNMNWSLEVFPDDDTLYDRIDNTKLSPLDENLYKGLIDVLAKQLGEDKNKLPEWFVTSYIMEKLKA